MSAKSNAHQPEKGKVMASFGPYLYRTHVPSSYGTNPALLGGFGLLAEGDVDYNGGIEIGLFYMHKEYYRRDGALLFAEKSKRIHINMGYRHWFNKAVSASLGFYSAYSMGDPERVHSDYNLKSEEPDTSAEDTTEYGFDASVLFDVMQTEHWSLFFDARYSHSVTSKINEEAHHYGIMVGCKLPVPVN